ncbi:hypothetical protein BBJ28_00008893 [Nothophytophthora sp. Chile5]|nr:hypothetical protein BBJ28_00008893 [Nothophytophthora sp. Chile5]
MGGLKTVTAQAVLLGGVAAWMTSAYTSPLSPEWAAKDYLFVLAVVAVVFVFACLQEAFAPGGIAAGISLKDTSPGKADLLFESREELAMYEVKGRKASSFRELKEFPFSIGIEDGFMSKECVGEKGIFPTISPY